jgi:ATP-dependent DNA ligase
MYAGRVGTGIPDKVLANLRRRLEPLSRAKAPLDVPAPRKTRFGSPLVLSRAHWVEPNLVAEIACLTWTPHNLCGTPFTSASAKTSWRRTFYEKPRALARQY